jgi:hypothetical protein
VVVFKTSALCIHESAKGAHVSLHVILAGFRRVNGGGGHGTGFFGATTMMVDTSGAGLAP